MTRDRDEQYEWFHRMRETFPALTREEREALNRWQARHLGNGTVGTVDWPGWERYIGRFPDGQAMQGSSRGGLYLVR